MKVIESSGAGAKAKRFKCGGCGAKLEVNGKDLTLKPDARDGNAYTFRCPECRHETWIAASLVPPGMRSEAG